MITVRILHPWMPKYRESFFNSLQELGNKSGINYLIYSGKSPKDSTGRNDEIDLSSRWTLVPSMELNLLNRSLILHKLEKEWKNSDLVITEHAIRNIVLYKWLFWKRPRRIALWGHGKTYTKTNTKLEELLKSKLVNRADWFFSYTQNGADSIIQGGFSPLNTTVVLNSTDTKTLNRMINSIKREDVEDFRKKYNLGTGPCAVFIGALDPSKRLDFLISAAVKVQEKVPNFQLLIFGNGPELNKITAACTKYPFIKYCGRAEIKTQALISKVGSIIMMPGRVGLIAVDSLTMQLPIVTTRWPWHAPEIEYLTPGENSLVCEDNVEVYSAEVVKLLKNEELLASMKKYCAVESKKYTTENMALNFHEGVLKALAKE